MGSIGVELICLLSLHSKFYNRYLSSCVLLLVRITLKMREILDIWREAILEGGFASVDL